MTNKLTKSEQARINGAKSKGPTSIEGKARSSQNSIKHGFAAVINVVLRIEDQTAFHQHLEGLRASYKPNDYAEHTFVDQLAGISWRQSRLVGLETALIDAQISIQNRNLCTQHPDSADDEYFHLVKAWQALAHQPQKPDANEPIDPSLPPVGYDITSIELVRRYQVSLDRQFRNTLLNFRQYRKDFAPAQPATQDEPNSPTPLIEEINLAHPPKAKPVPFYPPSIARIQLEAVPNAPVGPTSLVNKR